MSDTVRVKKEGNYFAVSNVPFNDKKLSWEARGMMGYLLSKPDDWTVRVGNLINAGDAGLHKVRRILKELETSGYLQRIRLRSDDGKYYWESTVRETPTIVQFSTDGSSTDGSSTDGKPADLTSTDVPNTDVPNTESVSTDKSLNTFSLFLESWQKKFPKKTQPRNGDTKLKKSFITRIKDKDFKDNWEQALHNASRSPFLQDKAWFKPEWFLRNDDNWRRVLVFEFDWADEQNYGYKGSDKAKEAVEEEKDYSALREEILKQREYRKKHPLVLGEEWKQE